VYVPPHLDDEELRKKEEHLGMLKEQNEKINHIYLLKLKKMEAELKDVTERQKIAEEKGRSEINSLKGQIRMYIYSHADSRAGWSMRACGRCGQRWPEGTTRRRTVRERCRCRSCRTSTARWLPSNARFDMFRLALVKTVSQQHCFF
jgi:hypothetical protein